MIFPFFYAFLPFCIFPLFLRISPVFLRFSLLLPKDKGKQQQFTAKKWGISLRPPSALTPCKTSRALRAPNPKKSPRESPGASRPQGQKSVQKSLKTVSVGDRQPRSSRGIFGGVVCEFSEPKRKAKYAPPPVLHSRR